MTQNIYDTEVFFEGYSKMGRSVEGLAGAPSGRLCKPCYRRCRG